MKFDPKEIENVNVVLPSPEHPTTFLIEYHSPISRRENYRRFLDGKAEWQPLRYDVAWFCPEIIPDNPARAFVIEGEKYTGQVGGKDMFGIDWEYVPSAKGSIVRPGNPTLVDITKWKEVIKFPNVDEWDWEGSAKKNAEYLKNAQQFQNLCIFTGYFERLISWMDFGPASYALMNKKMQPYVDEIFAALTDLWIDIVDHAVKYYAPNLDGFAFHDDWGAQHSPFFNKAVVDKMLVPHMKRLTDHIHELGYKCELHSCGKLKDLIISIEDAGWDTWQGMAINDFEEAYGKTRKLIMNVAFDDKLKPLSVEERIAEADKFVDFYGHKDHPAVLANRSASGVEFFFEVYKKSRELFGA